ncbi:MAG TPA: hypothetical protein VJJ22_00415 [Candidatus Paceibacterota bacterium]
MKSKITFSLSLATALMLSLGSVAFAQIEDGATSSVREIKDKKDALKEKRAEVKDKKDELKDKRDEAKSLASSTKEELKEKRDALRTEVVNKRMELVRKFGVKMTSVHRTATERLTKLADRIDSRIKKIEKQMTLIETEKKVDLTEAKIKLADARAKIATAGVYVEGIMANVDVATSGTDPKLAFETVRGYFAISRDNLKVAHQSLNDVLKGVKRGLGMKVDDDGSASSTDQ